jgi:ABC-type Fe3+ transport system permease subunit
MVTRKSLVTVCGTVIVALIMAASAHGWNARRTTQLTFSGPVALPGVTLAAGTYIFERASEETSNVVQVLSRDRSTVYLMAMTLRTKRPAGMSADRFLTFAEAPAGAPVPITAWYPRGEAWGHAFIYESGGR